MGKALRSRGSALDQHIAATRAAINDNWVERNPAAAAAETAFRRERRTIRKDHGHSVHATPETRYRASKQRQGALARLYQAGDLSLDELARAIEIRDIYERITGDVHVRTVSLETRVDVSRLGGEHFERQLGAVRAEVAYSAWRRAIGALGTNAAGAILAMIVEDAGVSIAAKRWRMRNAGAKGLLHRALELWATAASEAARDVDHGALLAAQAGL